MEFYRAEYSDFKHEAPRPHAKVLELMRSCHLLALPSIVEGRALVQQEALSCGLPLIVTPNAGGEDLIDPGETGFLVPIRSPEQIAEKIAWFDSHRSKREEMCQHARRKAAQYSWEEYGRRILAGFCE
jgi:glycosyltransferase involved in cell wall biosynthesis